MGDEDVVYAHLLANRGYVPLAPLDAPPEFTWPFLEYFAGSWLQLFSAPYFWFYKRETLSFWFYGRFRSTYRPGVAFLCLMAVVALSLALGLNPTEGYLLLALHTYSSALVAIHFGFLSPKQRRRFLTFSSVKQLRARKAFAEDPMITAEALSGQPLSGSLTVLNGALLRLLAESDDGTANTLHSADSNPAALAPPRAPSGTGSARGSKRLPVSPYLEFGSLVTPLAAAAPAGFIARGGTAQTGTADVAADLLGGLTPGEMEAAQLRPVKVKADAASLLQQRAKLGHEGYSAALLQQYCDMVQLDELEAQLETEEDGDCGHGAAGREGAAREGKPQGVSVTAFAGSRQAQAGALIDDSGAGSKASTPSTTIQGTPAAPSAAFAATGGLAGSDEALVLEEAYEPGSATGFGRTQGEAALTGASGTVLAPPPLLAPTTVAALDFKAAAEGGARVGSAMPPARPPRPAQSDGLALGAGPGHQRRLSSGTHQLRAAWGALGSFRPYKWRLPSRLFAREIAARASTGASISPMNLRIARLLAFLAIVMSAIQFAYPYNCVFLVSTGYCDESVVVKTTPDMVGRLIVFFLAAAGAYDSAFVILRLILRIKARSSKRLQMLRAVTDSIDFSASLRSRLPFVDLRLPENACYWTAALESLVNFYEQKDNVNSYEILSTIMAWNAVVSLVSLVIIVLLALSFVQVQVQTFLAFSYWGILLSGGLGLAFYEEASTNDLLEELSRRLQRTRTLIAEEITSLRQANLEARAALAAAGAHEGDDVELLAAASVALSGGGEADEREALRRRVMARASKRPSVAPSESSAARQYSASPRGDAGEEAAGPGLSRPPSKLDVLERKAQAMQSTSESAASLNIAQREKLASTLENAARVLDGKIGELSSGAARSRLFGIVISFTLLRGFVAAVLTTVLSLASVVLGNRST